MLSINSSKIVEFLSIQNYLYSLSIRELSEYTTLFDNRRTR